MLVVLGGAALGGWLLRDGSGVVEVVVGLQLCEGGIRLGAFSLLAAVPRRSAPVQKMSEI